MPLNLSGSYYLIQGSANFPAIFDNIQGVIFKIIHTDDDSNPIKTTPSYIISDCSFTNIY